jgi:transposase
MFVSMDYAALQAENQALREQNEQLRQELAELKRLIYGSKRERFVAQIGQGQLSLLSEEEVVAKACLEKQTYQRAIAKSATSIPPSRKLLPAHLPRVEVILEPEDDTTAMKKIGEQVSEELDYQPAKLFVRRYVRPRYVSEGEDFHIAPLPNRPIDKGIPGPGLLAQILMDKFVDHLPVYRQVQRYERLGMKLSESTLGGWLSSTCELLSPLYDALQECVLSQTYLQVDETPIPVLDKKKKGKTHRGYQWAYHSPEVHLVFFEYQPGRGRATAARKGPKNAWKTSKVTCKPTDTKPTNGSMPSAMILPCCIAWRMPAAILKKPWIVMPPERAMPCPRYRSSMLLSATLGRLTCPISNAMPCVSNKPCPCWKNGIAGFWNRPLLCYPKA